MDARDFEILVGLLEDPTASYESLGRQVGLSGTSVKNRLDRMQHKGPLAGLVGLPHAAVFDRESAIYWRDQPQGEVRDRLDEVLAVDPVVWVSLLHTGEVAVMIYREPTQPAPPALAEVLGTELVGGGGLAGWPGDESETVLSSLDWRLLQHLVGQPRSSVADLVERTGLSRNTVRKRRARLFDTGLLGIFPLLEQARSPGLVLYSVVAHVETPDVRAAVQRALPGAVPVVHGVSASGSPGTTFMGHAETLAEVTLACQAVDGLDGVEQAQLIIDLERRFARDRVEGWVDDQVDRWEQARRG